MKLIEEWHEIVDTRNSVLCAGLDPAEFEMGRGDSGLPEHYKPSREYNHLHKQTETAKQMWSTEYLMAVLPHIAAVKPNFKYWGSPGFIGFHEMGIKSDSEYIEDIVGVLNLEGILTIKDDKIADIGETNDEGFYNADLSGFDAATFAPYAGNINQARKIKENYPDLGIITMGLMSSTEYERVKNNLVQIRNLPGFEDSVDEYMKEDIILVNGEPYVKQYIFDAKNARKYGIEGIVIGAPKSMLLPDGNKIMHPTMDEIKKVRDYVGDEMLVLMPGVGAQGGEAKAVWQYFGKNDVIVNVGRGLMFPKGSYSTPAEQAEAASFYNKMLNEARNG